MNKRTIRAKDYWLNHYLTEENTVVREAEEQPNVTEQPRQTQRTAGSTRALGRAAPPQALPCSLLFAFHLCCCFLPLCLVTSSDH